MKEILTRQPFNSLTKKKLQINHYSRRFNKIHIKTSKIKQKIWNFYKLLYYLFYIWYLILTFWVKPKIKMRGNQVENLDSDKLNVALIENGIYFLKTPCWGKHDARNSSRSCYHNLYGLPFPCSSWWLRNLHLYGLGPHWLRSSS